jgi:hypothetical protein
MMKLYNFLPDKGRDRGYVHCPHCHEAIKECPHCKKDALMEKAKGRLDYRIIFEWIEVECKQGTETWSLDDFTKPQERLFQEVIQGFTMRWLFLEIGDGRAPKGKEAYLIPAQPFLKIRTDEAVANRKSVRFRKTERSRLMEARELFAKWQLEWATGTGWTIPDDHIFWKHRFPDQTIAKEATVTEPKEEKPHDIEQPAFAPARLSMLD